MSCMYKKNNMCEHSNYTKECIGEHICDAKEVACGEYFCYGCRTYYDDIAYSPTIYFLDGTYENIEDIIVGMTEEEMDAYEKDIKNEYDNVDYVGFGEFCPHCLSCI